MVKRLAGIGMAFALALGVFAACGSDDDSDKDESSTTAPSTWESGGAAAVVKASCSDAGCHDSVSPGVGASKYEDNETLFKANATTIKDRLGKAKTDGLYMPQGNTAFSDADKQKLIDFLDAD